MSLADRIPRRGARTPVARINAVPAPTVTAPAPVSATPAPRPTPNDELQRRRDTLARRFADLQWDLGGVAYEMASRDHFRLDVLTRQAAELQEVDAELAGIERLLRLGNAGAAGSCPSCGSLYARGATFCWSCGTTLIEQAAPSTNGARGAPAA